MSTESTLAEVRVTAKMLTALALISVADGWSFTSGIVMGWAILAWFDWWSKDREMRRQECDHVI